MVARKVLLPDQAFLDAIGLTAALSGAPTLHPVPRSPQFCWRVQMLLERMGPRSLCSADGQ